MNQEPSPAGAKREGESEKLRTMNALGMNLHYGDMTSKLATIEMAKTRLQASADACDRAEAAWLSTIYSDFIANPNDEACERVLVASTRHNL